MDPQIRRWRTLDALKRIVLRESVNQSLVVIFEDLHWIDSQTQALLDLLADSIANARVLLLVNYRPEYRHQWAGKSYYTQLGLSPLGQERAEELLAALLGDAAELGPLKRLVADKSGGNPFFIEELVQGFFDEGVLTHNGGVRMTRSLGQVRFPPTVQAILSSRIDRLPAQEKGVLQSPGRARQGHRFQSGPACDTATRKRIDPHLLRPASRRVHLRAPVFWGGRLHL